MDPLTNTLRALADPTRCKILELLHKDSRSVNDLAQHFSMSRPAVSKHLAILREAELVASRRQGRQQIYEMDATPLEQACEWLRHFDAEENEPRRPQPRILKPSGRSDDWRCW